VKKYPFPTFGVDLSGDIMLGTLEYFAYAGGWRTKKQFLEDFGVASWENPTPGTRVNVRLLRYTRAGLLERRRTRKKTRKRYEYEYMLSPKGLDRYIFKLKSRGLLNPTNAKTVDQKEMMLNRIAVVRLLLEKRKEELLLKLDSKGNTYLSS
jgi:hypothetical protein